MDERGMKTFKTSSVLSLGPSRKNVDANNHACKGSPRPSYDRIPMCC